MRANAIVIQSVDILKAETPAEIEKLDANDPKKIAYITDTYKTQVQDRIYEAVEWLERYYYERNPRD